MADDNSHVVYGPDGSVTITATVAKGAPEPAPEPPTPPTK